MAGLLRKLTKRERRKLGEIYRFTEFVSSVDIGPMMLVARDLMEELTDNAGLNDREILGGPPAWRGSEFAQNDVEDEIAFGRAASALLQKLWDVNGLHLAWSASTVLDAAMKERWP